MDVGRLSTAASAAAQLVVHGLQNGFFFLQVKATPHITYFHKGIAAYFRTGANKSKLEAGLRRFYNTDEYSLPQRILYPLIKPPSQPA